MPNPARKSAAARHLQRPEAPHPGALSPSLTGCGYQHLFDTTTRQKRRSPAKSRASSLGIWSGRRESPTATNQLINKDFFWLPKPEMASKLTTSALLMKGVHPPPSAGGYRQPLRSGSDRFCDLQCPSLESLGNRVRLSLGSMQVRHDLVGAVVQRSHADSPSMGVLDARLRG